MDLSFSAHNIRLDDGSVTIPSFGWQMQDLPLVKFSRQLLGLVFAEGTPGKRIADLGCLEGGYAVEFARDGFDTLGIEIRQSNFENCQMVKRLTDLPNLEFACDDVRQLEKYGVFDAIFCCGLLYHIERPRDFIELMSRVCRRALIIDTHVATDQPNRKFQLSEITQNEGLAGRWFSEGDDDQQRHADKWSAWDNARSFWPMKRDLIELLGQLGFSMVLEYPIFDSLRETTDRVTIAAVRN